MSGAIRDLVAQAEAFLRGGDPSGGVARAEEAARTADSLDGPPAEDLREKTDLVLSRAEATAREWREEVARRHALHTANELRAAGVPVDHA